MPRSYGTTNAAPSSTTPTVGLAGDTYYSTVRKLEYVSDGTVWRIKSPPTIITSIAFSGEPLTTGYVISGSNDSIATPTYNYRMLVQSTWTFWHPNTGADVFIRWSNAADVNWVTDHACRQQTMNALHYGAHQFTADIAANNAASLRMRIAASVAGGGVRTAFSIVTIVPT